MPIRQLIALITLALLGLTLAPPAAAQVRSVSPFAVTPGRLAGSLASLTGLMGVAAGGLALARARRPGTAPRSGKLALVAGLISTLVGGLLVATAEGGPGTGHGFGGGIVALMAGSMSLALAGLTRARTRGAG